ncbi:MAG TPA: phosphoribosylglycinamide formyltransferase [Bacteroidales bacterium]|mgnify:FL=1|nr:phosphoribosylglycinamide formyltransferase [Bacteroidales bacterium]HPM91972.1 phosphoribosylglycinamide formyltransferase [Bacteroidales bacterium]
MINIAIFASGNGSNAQNIAEYFQNHPAIRVSLILANKPDAFVLERAKNLGIPSHVFNRKEFYETNDVLQVLLDHHTDFIVLAGFLWFVPDNLLSNFSRKIINIHPALLPRHGGKGMYGDKVHKAVIESGDKVTGITIHFVNDHYDEGEVIFQESIPVIPGDTSESIAQKVHQLEYLHFPRIIEEVIKSSSVGG